MKTLGNIGVLFGAFLAIVIICWEALLLTIFSSTQEFWYAAQALSAAVWMLALGVVLRLKVRKWVTMGGSLLFSLCAVALLVFHIGQREGYVARMEISLPTWHFTAFTYLVIAFGAIPLVLLIRKWPNQSPEPTRMLGTSAAEPPRVPSTRVAHL